MAARSPRLESWHPRALVGAVTLITLGLGFLRLGYRGLSRDEAVSLRRAGESTSHLWATVTGEDTNMSLYYAVLKVWTGLFGSGVVSARGLSVVFAALTVPVVYATGKRLFGEAGGLVAALLLALNAYFLRYAQEARAYSLAVLLVAISSYAFVVELERPSRRSRALYVTSSVVAFYAHYYAAWVTVAQCAVLVTTRWRTVGRTWLAMYAAIGLFVAPMVYAGLTLDHNPIYWVGEPGWRSLWDTAAELAGDSFRELGAILAICLLAIPWTLRSPRLRWGLVFTAVWVALPMVAAFTVSQFHPIFLSKYLIVCLPGVMLLAAGAVTSLRPWYAAAAVLAVVIVTSGPPLRAWYRWPGQEDWRGLTGYVLHHRQTGDAVAFSPPYAGSELERFSPAAVAPLRNVMRGHPATISDASAKRIWLVIAFTPAAETLRRELARAYELRDQRRFPNDIGVELYVRR